MILEEFNTPCMSFKISNLNLIHSESSKTKNNISTRITTFILYDTLGDIQCDILIMKINIFFPVPVYFGRHVDFELVGKKLKKTAKICAWLIQKPQVCILVFKTIERSNGFRNN